MPPSWHTLLLLLPACISALSFDCKEIRADGHTFNLEKLGGPKTVHNVRWVAPSVENTTFTIDVCNPLKKVKDVPKDEDCPTGTRVCGKEWDYPRGSEGFVKQVIPIAGEYTGSHGRGLEPKYTRLKTDKSNTDEKEGLLVELHGGKHAGRTQKAIVEFLCDKDVTGNEGFKSEELEMIDISEYGMMRRTADDDDDDEGEPKLPDLDKNKNLEFKSYGSVDGGDVDVLRLRWRTKYACEDAADSKDPGDSKGGWGFFTWFIIVVFMLAAAYIIFGSWLNYNRYGARGWDLIPHGDSIRDVPYIIKDWISGFTERLKGGDSRGGYSAV